MFFNKLTLALNNFTQNPKILYVYMQSIIVVSFSKSVLSLVFLTTNTYNFLRSAVPTELLIGYYNVHPYILYVALIRLSINQISQTCLQNSAHRNFLLLLVALLLGGNWGWGNSSWGFFWVGDTIEWLLFALVIISLWYLHFQKMFINAKIGILTITIICLTLCSLRWGLIFSRHSFFAGSSLKNTSLSFILLNWPSTITFASWFLFGKFIKIVALVFLHYLNTENIRFTKKKQQHKFFFSALLIWTLTISNNYTLIKKSLSNGFYNCVKNSFTWRLNVSFLTSKKLTLYSPKYLGTLQIKTNTILNIMTEYAQAFYYFIFL